MSENYDGHKETIRPEVSNNDEKNIQGNYNVPVENYSFQPNNFSLFIPSNVFPNTSSQISTPMNNSMQTLHTPISSASNISMPNIRNIGMDVDNLLPNLQFTNFINNIDQPQSSFIMSENNCQNQGNFPDNYSNFQNIQSAISLSIPNQSSKNTQSLSNYPSLSHKNGSTSITSEDSSFSNPEGWKARSGERDDIPNPRKVVEILRELEKSQQEMNKLRENYLNLPNAKRERNRVASRYYYFFYYINYFRTCRLKKKAVYEINKIKVFHLDAEYSIL